MITEMVTGLVSGLIHGEFENVEWKLRPMNETTKLMLLIAITGMIATFISVSAVYNYFQIHKVLDQTLRDRSPGRHGRLLDHDRY